MFIDKYENNRVSKYLNRFDKVINGFKSSAQTNNYLCELESTFKEEKASFDEILCQKLKSFKAEFVSHSGESVYADMYHPGITKVLSKHDDPDMFYSAYSLNDFGYTICERIDEIKSTLEDRPSSIGSELRESFEELLILIFIYGFKFVETSDDYFTWCKEKDTTFRQANDLKKLFLLCKKYKDIGCRLWVVKYLKRCNSRLIVLDDIDFDEVNYLKLNGKEKEEEREKIVSNNDELIVAEGWLWDLVQDIGEIEKPTHEKIERRIKKEFPKYNGVPTTPNINFIWGDKINKRKIDVALTYLFNKRHNKSIKTGTINSRVSDYGYW